MWHPRSATGGARRAWSAPLLALTAAAAVAACGSSSGAGSGGSGSTTIKAGLGGNIFDLPLRVADEKGYFKRQGLNVQFVTLTASTGTPALQSGSVQFLNDSPTDFLTATSKGTPEIAVGVDSIGSPLGLIVTKKFAADHHLTASTPSATVAKALIGSTAGASAPTTKAEAGVMLRSYGVQTSQMKWATLPSPAADEAALKSGQIDWFVTSEPIPLQVQSSGSGVVVVGPEKAPAWDNSRTGIGTTLVATKGYASSNSSTVSRFATAVQKADEYIRGHEQQVLPIARQALPGVPDSVLLQSMKLVDWPATVKMSAAEWATSLGWINRQGLIGGLGSTLKTSDYTNEYIG
jgi:NitT/TauT family transport system substrate-binding protein